MFHYFTYRDETLTCKRCGWQGTGRELRIGEISEVHWIWDLDCPKCHETVGSVQAPLIEEVDAWKKDHPGWVDG